MELKISRTELSRGLAIAARVAARKSTLPILSHALLRADRHTLTVAATDLNVSAVADLPCHVEAPGAIAVNAADLQRFVAAATGDEVRIKVDGSAWAVVTCGKSKYRIPGLSDRDFPKVPAEPSGAVEVDAAVLASMLTGASYAVSLDSTRGALCGVNVEVTGGDKVTMSSTDGHRLVTMTRMTAMARSADGAIIVSAIGATEFARLLDDHKTCRVAFGERLMSVSAGGVVISAGLLDFTFPPIHQVIPKGHKATAIVDRDVLLAAIKRVAPLASDVNGVRVSSTATGLLLSSYSEGSELSDEVDCEIKGTIKFAAHPKYLNDALSHMTGDAVTMRFVDELAPVALLDNDDIAVVMPMRM